MAIKDLKSKRSKFTDNNMLSAATAGELSRAISANENSRVSPDEIKQIKLTNIKIHPDNIYNKNDTEEALYELAQNIKENGLMHNAVVTRRPGRRAISCFPANAVLKPTTFCITGQRKQTTKRK